MGLSERAIAAHEQAVAAQTDRDRQRRHEDRQGHLRRFGDVLKRTWLSDIPAVDITLTVDPEGMRTELLTADIDGVTLGMYANQNEVHLIRPCDRCGDPVASHVLTDLAALGSALTSPPQHVGVCPKNTDEEGEPLYPLRCTSCGWPIDAEGVGQPVQVQVGEGEYVDGSPKLCEGLGGKHDLPEQVAQQAVPTPADALAGAIRLLVVQTMHELGVPMA